MSMSRALRGFTLVEMAIVLVVVSLIITGGLNAVGPIIDARKSQTTSDRMDLVQQALQVYVAQYGCLPCPADGTLASSAGGNVGLAENTGGTYTTASVHCTSTACRSASAVVPWRDLGISEDEASDAWGNRMRYAVANGTPCGTAVGVQDTDGMNRCGTSSFPAGGISIDDIDTVASPDYTNAAYVLVSSGPDRSLAFAISTGTLSANRYGQASGGQFENTNGDATYAVGELNSTNGTAHFDDITRFVTAPVMIIKCGVGACGNTDPG